MHAISSLAVLLKDYGPWAIAALAIGYGALERKERKLTQDKFDKLAEKLPEELLGIVKETNATLAGWTATANAVLGKVSGG